MSVYSNCRSGIIQKCERLFPFMNFRIVINWDLVLEEMLKIEVS